MTVKNQKHYIAMMNNHLSHIKNKKIDKIRPEHIQHTINSVLGSGRTPRIAQTIQAYS